MMISGVQHLSQIAKYFFLLAAHNAKILSMLVGRINFWILSFQYKRQISLNEYRKLKTNQDHLFERIVMAVISRMLMGV